MYRMRACAIVAAAVLLALPAAVSANVYPTNLSQSANIFDVSAPGSVNLGFLLNQDATTGVTVDVLNSFNTVVRSYSYASLAKGSQSVSWDGKDNFNNVVADGNYSFKVTASASGFGGWTDISTDSSLNNFYSPRGVSVNMDPTSKYYGRIYVVEPAGGLTGLGRTTTEGLYLLNADLSDAVGQGNAGKTGGVAWGTTNSPFRVEVGPDGKVYVCDWSDSHSGLWMGDENFSSASELLDSTGRAASGLNTTHGSISGFMVEGTGASRQIFTMDEDMVNGGPAGRLGSLWRYDIGNAALFAGPPSAVVYDDGIANKIQNYTNDVIRAKDGTLWISQTRAGGTDTLLSLMQVSADGSTILWTSIPTLAATSAADPLRRTYGIAYDPVNNYLAIATYNNGNVVIFDEATKSVVTTFSLGGGAASANRDIAFDAVGNLYIVNNTVERLKVFSPGGANTSFTLSLAPLGAIQVVPEPGSLLALGAGLAGFAGLLRKKS